MGNDQSSKQQAAPAPRRPTQGERSRQQAIGAIKVQKEQLALSEKRILHKEKRMAQLRKEAKALIARAKTPAQKKIAKRQAGNKIKQIKMLEKQVISEQGKMTRLMQQEMMLEQAVADAATVNATQQANAAMHTLLPGIDEVDDIMDQNQEMRDQANEITDLLGQPMGDEIDEDDLEAELAQIEEENAMEQMADLPVVPTGTPSMTSLSDSGRALAQASMEDVLPVAPSGPIAVPAGGPQDDDGELAALEAMMG